MFLSFRNSQFESKRGGGGVRGRLRAMGESPLDKDTDISHRYTRGKHDRVIVSQNWKIKILRNHFSFLV